MNFHASLHPHISHNGNVQCCWWLCIYGWLWMMDVCREREFVGRIWFFGVTTPLNGKKFYCLLGYGSGGGGSGVSPCLNFHLFIWFYEVFMESATLLIVPINSGNIGVYTLHFQFTQKIVLHGENPEKSWFSVVVVRFKPPPRHSAEGVFTKWITWLGLCCGGGGGSVETRGFIYWKI